MNILTELSKELGNAKIISYEIKYNSYFKNSKIKLTEIDPPYEGNSKILDTTKRNNKIEKFMKKYSVRSIESVSFKKN